MHGSPYLSSGLSILIHGIISLQDVTSCDKNHCTASSKSRYASYRVCAQKCDFKVVLWSYDKIESNIPAPVLLNLLNLFPQLFV